MWSCEEIGVIVFPDGDVAINSDTGDLALPGVESKGIKGSRARLHADLGLALQ